MPQQSQEIKLHHLAFAIVVVVSLWLGNWYVGTQWYSEQTRGVFGDMFGAVNALFSGLALAGLVYAILLQRQEIALAKQDASRTKLMLDEQTKHLEEQNRRSELQAFETTFFQLLELLSSVTTQIDVKINLAGGSSKENSGKDSFVEFVEYVKSSIRNEKAKNPVPMTNWNSETYDLRYDSFYNYRKEEISHYYRTSFHLMKFIDTQCPGNKYFYSDIYRAQLSNAEVGLLFYNCLSSHGRKHFKPLVEKYGLLKHVDNDDIAYAFLKTQFDPTAFGDNKTS